MSSAWFYLQDRDQLGPESEDALRQMLSQRRLSGDTLVWHEALPDWEPARKHFPEVCTPAGRADDEARGEVFPPVLSSLPRPERGPAPRESRRSAPPPPPPVAHHPVVPPSPPVPPWPPVPPPISPVRSGRRAQLLWLLVPVLLVTGLASYYAGRNSGPTPRPTPVITATTGQQGNLSKTRDKPSPATPTPPSTLGGFRPLPHDTDPEPAVSTPTPPRIISEWEVRAAVQRLYRLAESYSHDSFAACYAESGVKSNGKFRERDFFRVEHIAFRDGYQSVSFQLGEITVRRDLGSETATATFDLRYRHVKKTGVVLTGTASEVTVLRRFGPELLVVAEEEVVTRGASSTPPLQTEMEVYVANFYRLMAARNLDGVLNLMASQLHYKNAEAYGVVSRSFVQKDLVRYFERYSLLSFAPGPLTVNAGPGGDINLSFRLSYRAQRPDGPRSGSADESWTLRRVNGRLLIVSWKESIHRD